MTPGPRRLLPGAPAADVEQVDLRIAGLVAGSGAALSAVVVAAVVPAAEAIGDVALGAAGVVAGMALWLVAGRRERGWRGWRLIAVATPLPAAGVVLAAVLTSGDALQMVAVRWLATLPGYGLALLGLFTLVRRRWVRVACPRLAVELALLLTACAIENQLLLIGPVGSWSRLRLGERLVLGAGVLITAAAVAAALLILGSVDAARQRTAAVLLVGASALSMGRALQTAALLADVHDAMDASRMLIVAGLSLVVLAAMLDPGAPPAGDRQPSEPTRTTLIGQVLPHLAMAVATAAVGVVALFGHGPTPVSVAGVVLMTVLAAVHRWLSAREDLQLGARLRRNEAYFRSLVHAGGNAVLILDSRLRIRWMSPPMAALLDRPDGELAGADLRQVVHPDDAAPLTTALERAEPGSLLHFRLADAAGAWRSLEVTVSDLRGNAEVRAVVLHCRDVTERLAAERALARAAYTDELTGLPNTAGFRAALATAAGGPTRAEAMPVAVVLVEIDGLAGLRELHGSAATSAAVAELGRRLRGTLREEDLLARTGDRQFTALVHGTPADVDRVADRFLSVVEQPVGTEGGALDLSASVGIVDVPAEPDLAELLDRADLAVRAARANGPGTATRYRPALRDAAIRRDRLCRDLRPARARGELSLVFQPVVELTEHRVSALEVRLRWRHGALGEVPTSELLPVAEAAGVTGELQRWLLAQAMEAVAGLPAVDPPIRLAVPVFPGCVATGSLVSDVATALGTSGVAADLLLLEFPESALVEQTEQLAADTAALRMMGVRVAVENFGVGHTPLVQLSRMPVDTLKFDRAFVARIDTDQQSRAMVESVCGVGRALGLQVVADGIETPAQLALLRAMGCDLGLGTLIARPMPLAEVATLLAEGDGRLWPGVIGQSS